jgi:dipeptidyl-peptidase-4
MTLDPGSAALGIIAEHEDRWWLDVVPGSPTRDETGSLVEVLADHSCDTYRVYRDGQPLSPVGLQVHALLDATAARVTVLAGTDPMVLDAYRIDTATGEAHCLTDGSGWSSAVCSGEVLVTITADATQPRSIARAGTPTTSIQIQNLAQHPALDIRPIRSRVGADALPACLLMPTGHIPGTKVPVIMSPYGGPHAQRVIGSALAFASDQWFADQGFAVIVADGRGTPGRGPAWERSIAEDWSAAVVEDQVQALEAIAQANPDLDVGRVGIRGWSFGGYLAALAVMERPDVFAAAVAGAPVTDWRLYDTAYTERYLADPTANADGYERASLLRRAPQLTRPLLLIHGLADDNVLVAHTLQLSSALLAAGRPHSVVPLSGVTHMTPQEVVAENLMMLEVEFFLEHLLA